MVAAAQELQARFDFLAARWREETGMCSSASRMAAHPAYQEIIGMGAAAVPLILRDLERHGPDHWFTALYRILGTGPLIAPEDAGRMEVMRQAWLEWGRENGYL